MEIKHLHSEFHFTTDFGNFKVEWHTREPARGYNINILKLENNEWRSIKVLADTEWTPTVNHSRLYLESFFAMSNIYKF